MHGIDAGALGEHHAGQMRRGANTRASEIGASGLLRPGQEFGQRLRRHMIGSNNKNVRQLPGQRRRDHVALGIVGHLAVEKLVDREMPDGRGADGIAIRRTAGDGCNADIAAGAATVLDDKRLAEICPSAVRLKCA